MFYDIDLDVVYYACLTQMELLCSFILVIILWEGIKKFLNQWKKEMREK